MYLLLYGIRVLQSYHERMEAKTVSHDLMGDNVDSLPSDISELIARRGRCKQSFIRAILDCDCVKNHAALLLN